MPLSAEQQDEWAVLEAQRLALPSPPCRKGKPSLEEQQDDAPRLEALRRYRQSKKAFLASLGERERAWVMNRMKQSHEGNAQKRTEKKVKAAVRS